MNNICLPGENMKSFFMTVHGCVPGLVGEEIDKIEWASKLYTHPSQKKPDIKDTEWSQQQSI